MSARLEADMSRKREVRTGRLEESLIITWPVMTETLLLREFTDSYQNLPIDLAGASLVVGRRGTGKRADPVNGLA
jgi:hypothetical protein